MDTGWGPYQNLKQTVKVLINDNINLKEENKDLKEENKDLKEENKDLKIKLIMTESEDEDDRIIREAQERKALKNKNKIEEIKAEINIITEEIKEEYKVLIREAERQITEFKSQQERKIEENTANLKYQLSKYNPPQPIQIEKKRGGGGKASNLQSKNGETDFFKIRGIETLYFCPRKHEEYIIRVQDKSFIYKEKEFTSLNQCGVCWNEEKAEREGRNVSTISMWEKTHYLNKRGEPINIKTLRT